MIAGLASAAAFGTGALHLGAIGFGAPWGLLALLALPVIVWLHLFRRPPRERRIAGLFLFADAPPPGAAGRQRQRLRRTSSLLLELLAALLIALLLAEPRRPGGTGAGHLLIVLDDTASMSAVGDDGRDAAARARVAASNALDALGDAGRVTLLLTGEPPVVLAGPRAPVALARAALQRWTPGASHHDSQEAFALALDLVEAGDRLLFLTDDPDAPAASAFELLACGQRLGNAAIACAAREPAEAAENGAKASGGGGARDGAAGGGRDGEMLSVDVSASGGTPRTTHLLLHDAAAPGGAPLLDAPIELLPGETASARLALPAALAGRTLLLSLSDGGALALDDVARLPPLESSAVSVADLLPPDVSRALGVARLIAALPGLVPAADPASAQVLLAAAPGALVAGRVELVIAPTDAAPQVFLGPFLADHRHALLAGVTLDGVLWPAGSAAPPGAPLVMAGDLPLITEEGVGLARRLHLNLDARHGSLARSPDWPIFASNIAELARRLRPGLARRRVLVGEDIVWRGALGDGPLLLREPDGSEREAPSDGGFVARMPGEHVLLRDGAELARVQVDFADARESDLSACGEGQREADAGAAALAGLAATGIDPLLVRVLAGLLLAALAADWWVLRRERGR